MRVLHVGKYYPPHAGGMETYLRDLLDALQRRGVQNTALVHASRPRLRSQEDATTPGQPRVVRAATWGALLFVPLSPAFPWQLQKCLREERPEILHLHMPNASAFWALCLPRARRLPWVVHWHADVPVDSIHRGLRWCYRLYRPLEQWLLRRARVIVATSPAYRDSSRPLQTWREKCRVVPLGLATPAPAKAAPAAAPAAQAASDVEQVSSAPLRILAVGRLTYYKGFQILVQAMAACPAAQLDLVGAGEQRGALQAQIERLGLSGRVRLHGSLSDASLEQLWASSDCLCLPSIERAEAFGMVLLEAMARGKPCVATEVPGSGMAWVVEDRQTGLVVAPGDSAALARALADLATNPERRSRMGAAGRRRFHAHFTIDASATGILALYNRLQAAPPRQAP